MANRANVIIPWIISAARLTRSALRFSDGPAVRFHRLDRDRSIHDGRWWWWLRRTGENEQKERGRTKSIEKGGQKAAHGCGKGRGAKGRGWLLRAWIEVADEWGETVWSRWKRDVRRRWMGGMIEIENSENEGEFYYYRVISWIIWLSVWGFVYQ